MANDDRNDSPLESQPDIPLYVGADALPREAPPADNAGAPPDVDFSDRTRLDGDLAAEEFATASAPGEVPVPIVMSPAEIDERAQVVEALRGDQSAEAVEAERGTAPNDATSPVADETRTEPGAPQP